MRVGRVVDRLGEKRDRVAALHVHLAEVEREPVARVERRLFELHGARLDEGAVACEVNAQRLDPVIVARLDHRLDLEIHRDESVGLRILHLHFRRKIVRHREREFPRLGRGMPVRIEHGKLQPPRRLHRERARDFILRARPQEHALDFARRLLEVDRALAQRAVGEQPEGEHAAFERFQALELQRLLACREPRVSRWRDLHPRPLQLRREHHAHAPLLAQAVQIFRVCEEHRLAFDPLDLLREAALALVEHRHRHRLFRLSCRMVREEEFARPMAARTRRHQQAAAIHDLRGVIRRIADLQPSEGIRRMIAKRVGEAQQFRAGDVEEEPAHRDEAEQPPARAFRIEAQTVGACELFERFITQLLRVTRHRASREIARERRDGRVVRLRAELEDIDELRPEPRMPALQHARHMLEGIAPREGDPRAPARPAKCQQHKRRPERHARPCREMHHHIHEETRKQKSRDPRPAPQQRTAGAFLLENAIRRLEPRRERPERFTRRALRGDSGGRAHGRRDASAVGRQRNGGGA